MLSNPKKIGMVFSEVDVRLLAATFPPTGKARIHGLATIDREGKDDAALAMEIKQALRAQGLSNHPVAITLPDQDFLLKRILVPKLSKGDLRKFLLREIKKGLSLSEKEILFDSVQGKKSDEFGLEKVEISYLAASRARILKYAEIVMQAGLNPELVISSSLAMFTLMTRGMELGEAALSMIYLGKHRTTLAIAEEGHLVLSRRLHISAFNGTSGQEEEDFFDDAIREIKRTFLYCKKEITSKQIDRLMIAAPKALTRAQVDRIQSKLGLEVRQWHLSDAVEMKSGEAKLEGMAPGYLFALGAVAAALQKRPFKILPRLLSIKKYKQIFAKTAAVFLICLGITGVWNLLIRQDKLAELRVISDQQKEGAHLAEQAYEAASRRIEDQREMQTRIRVLSHIQQKRPPLQQFFQVISQAMPDQSFLETVKLKKDGTDWALTLEGRVLGKQGFDRMAAFAQLVEDIEKSQLFSELSFAPLENHPDLKTGMPFQIRATLTLELKPEEEEGNVPSESHPNV